MTVDYLRSNVETAPPSGSPKKGWDDEKFAQNCSAVEVELFTFLMCLEPQLVEGTNQVRKLDILIKYFTKIWPWLFELIFYDKNGKTTNPK